MNPYHSNCPICRKLGITVDTTHYIHCPAYRDMVCTGCKYHKYEFSGDWCRYRGGGRNCPGHKKPD